MRKLFILLFTSLWLTLTHAAVIAGNPTGNITLAFIYDYQCPHCHAMYPLLQTLEQEYPTLKIRMMPVAVLNQTSLIEASAAIAATNTNQFQSFTDTVMSEPALSSNEVTSLLNNMGLNTPTFQKTMHSQAVKQQLLQGQSLMDASNQHGVPLFILYPSALDPSHSLVL